MSHGKNSNTITLDATRLSTQSIIGCTVLPSRDDPTLTHGVALTTLNAYDKKYVKFEDIDGTGNPSHRYWKDVYLIIGINDPNYTHIPLKIGDKIFALFQNIDNTFTTIYFNAKIKQFLNKNEIIIDFMDDSGKYKNIKTVLYTNIQSKYGNITIPTVIRRICALNTNIYKNAIQKYQKTINLSINQNVQMPANQNIKKRKYNQINTNANINNNTIQQPPLKRQRSCRKKQKLKLKIPIKNISNVSSNKTTKIKQNAKKQPTMVQKRNVNKKKFSLRILRKPKKKEVKTDVVMAPPAMPLSNVKVNKRITPPYEQIIQRKKLKKMWGNYEIEMPMLSINNFYDFNLDVNKDNNVVDDDCFMSGLGIVQQWIKPQEIGDITVGPYVVDIDMFQSVC